jgi:hypothetical protein
MDPRIQELSDIILERCDSYKALQGYDDKAETYKAIRVCAQDIQLLLGGYNQRHPEED